MDKTLNIGRETAEAESRLKAYKVTSNLIDFMVKGKGEETDVIELTSKFLVSLSKWVPGHPKYMEAKEELIEPLKEKIGRQLILG